MVKIIGIVAVLFVCYCKIYAENDLHSKKSTTDGKDGEKYSSTMRKQEPDSERRPKYTTKYQRGDRIQENSRKAQNIGPYSNNDEDNDDIDNSAIFKRYEKQLRDELDELQQSTKSKKKKKHDIHSSAGSLKHHIKKIDTENSNEKDRNRHTHKHRKEENKNEDNRNIISYHSKPLEETKTLHKEENEYKNTKYSLTEEHEKRKGISGLDRTSFVKPSPAFSRDPKPRLEEAQERASDKKTIEHPVPSRKPPVLRKGLLYNNARKRQALRSTKMLALYQEGDDNQQGTSAPGVTSGSDGKSGHSISAYAIKEQIKTLMNSFPRANVSFETLGRTVEYNDIFIVKITNDKYEDQSYFRVKEYKYSDDIPEKKIIFLVHGLTVMGMKTLSTLCMHSQLRKLFSYYLKHLDKFDFFIIPLANPDGISILPVESGVWNKNVSPQTVCSGVCLDRNFDVAWNASHKISPCSQLYPGANPFSEVETRVIRDIFHRFGHKILAYIHVHPGTYYANVFKGEAVLYPRGYTDSPSNDDVYIDLKGEIDEAMKNASFRVMSVAVDTLHNWYGTVRGASVDYAAGVYGIPYAMEFVMQPYVTDELDDQALTEIWSRVIDVTFNCMWKSVNGSSNGRRRWH